MESQNMSFMTTQLSSTSIPAVSEPTMHLANSEQLKARSKSVEAHFIPASLTSTCTPEHQFNGEPQLLSSQSPSKSGPTTDLVARRANAVWKSRVALITRALEAWTPEDFSSYPVFASGDNNFVSATDDGKATPSTQILENTTSGQSASTACDAGDLSRDPPPMNNAFGAAGLGNDNVVYDEDQQAAIDAALDGESFFLTGSAGTGKSFVLKQIIRGLRLKGLSVAVTASTGCAAVAIQGCTIHSACGVGVGMDSIESLKKRARLRHIQAKLVAPDVLIIDEVSMLDAILFDKVEAMYTSGRTHFSAVSILKKRRHRALKFDANQAFGGLQVIVCGDFFQLPPVAPSDPKLQYSQQKMFAFESKAWRQAIRKTFVLGRVHRQADRNFIGLLNELRHGIVSRRTMRVLSACRVVGSVDEVDDEGVPVCYTKLYAFRRQVDHENERRLAELPGLCVAYRANDTIARDDLGILTEKTVEGLLENINVNNVLVLKKGARVLCMKNVNQTRGVVNGSAGTVIGFSLPKEELMRRRLVQIQNKVKLQLEKGQTMDEIEERKFRASLPFIINKESFSTQTKEVNEWRAQADAGRDDEVDTKCEAGADVKCDPKDVGKDGLKSKTDDGVKEEPELRDIQNQEPMTIDGLMKDEVVDLDHECFRKYRENERYLGPGGMMQLDCRCGDAIPVVRFDNGVIATMHEESWSIYGMRGQEVGERRQIPLALGWAMTIHKAQGTTLDKVETDVGKAFDFGQVYVALSRATSMQGLRITTFNASKVMAHDKVIDFYGGVYDPSEKSKKLRRDESANECVTSPVPPV